MLFHPDPGDPNLPGTYDTTHTNEWGVPYSPGEYGYGYGAYGYGYGYGDPVADPYGYENSETYGTYGSSEDPGGAGFQLAPNGNQMRDQAFQTANYHVYHNTGSHLPGSVLGQNASGGEVDEYGNPIEPYGDGSYGYGYGTTGLTTEQVTINDALQIQQDMKNGVRAQNYQDAEGAGAPEINGPMTPEANAAGGSVANGGMAAGASGIGAGLAGGGMPAGMPVSGTTLDPNAIADSQKGQLYDRAYDLYEELYELRRREKEASGDELAQIQSRIDEILAEIDTIAQELGVSRNELAQYHHGRKNALRVATRIYARFVHANGGDPELAWQVALDRVRRYLPGIWSDLTEYPEEQRSETIAMNISVAFNPQRIPEERIEQMIEQGFAKKYVVSGRTYVIADTPVGKFVMVHRGTARTGHRGTQVSRPDHYGLLDVVVLDDNGLSATDIEGRNVALIEQLHAGPAEYARWMDIAGGLSIIASLIPGVGTADQYMQGDPEWKLSALSDVLFFAGVGVYGKAGKAATFINIANVGVEGTVSGYRGYQAVEAWYDGEKEIAATKGGEALLRLLGVSVSVKSIRKVATPGVDIRVGKRGMYETLAPTDVSPKKLPENVDDLITKVGPGDKLPNNKVYTDDFVAGADPLTGEIFVNKKLWDSLSDGQKARIFYEELSHQSRILMHFPVVRRFRSMLYKISDLAKFNEEFQAAYHATENLRDSLVYALNYPGVAKYRLPLEAGVLAWTYIRFLPELFDNE